MSFVAIIQARTNSSRLPNKIFAKVAGKPLLEHIIERIRETKAVEDIIIATTINKSDDIVESWANENHVKCFRGSEKDVLDRYYKAAKMFGSNIIIRITADCPLVDCNVVTKIIQFFRNSDFDYVSNTLKPTYPDGLDVEIFTFSALETAWQNATNFFDREHVTPYIKTNKMFKKHNIENIIDYSSERWTVDEPEDLELIRKIYNYFSPINNFSWLDVLELKNKFPDWFLFNKQFKRDEGSRMGTGQKLWKRAKRVIPGGNMLLSKRAEMFLPERWPAYFDKAKGCKIWDLDGNEFFDMSIMGIGTNILGYGQPEVDNAVLETVRKGNMSTFNCPEEVYLAERLVQMHPWSDMVRFARTGGEANAIAVRIARAATGHDKVAFCGYHGWHDWYLSSNLGDGKNLVGHLLPGLEPNGVPESLSDTSFPFKYNKFEELEQIVKDHKIGVIIMEVSRNELPKNNFLQAVRELATKKNIVLIFDECTSGFRQSFGGLHKLYGVEPDMAMFGKAMSNGYAINAIIGKREVMEAAQKTFISSTFWTERIGPTAALKTLEIMEREKTWETITNKGNKIAEKWKILAKSHELDITVLGLPALISFNFNSSNALAYKTLITQEMLKKGYLAANSVYVSITHTDEIIEGYLNELDRIFKLIKECEEGRDIFSLLDGPICHAGFKRLN